MSLVYNERSSRAAKMRACSQAATSEEQEGAVSPTWLSEEGREILEGSHRAKELASRDVTMQKQRQGEIIYQRWK